MPPLNVTLGYTAFKVISSDNHDDNMDFPIDSLLDIVSSCALVALASGVWASKVGVSSVDSTCNHLDYLASQAGAAGVCGSDIISPGGIMLDPLE